MADIKLLLPELIAQIVTVTDYDTEVMLTT